VELGLLAVAGALAAVFVAIGPLLLKAIGPDSTVPTVTGMLVAGFVTLTGTLGQVTTVTWQGDELLPGGLSKHAAVIGLGVTVGLVILWYAAGALWDFAESGSTKPHKKRSETLTAARVIARAIRELRPPDGESLDLPIPDSLDVQIPDSPEVRNALL
jgi:hypothetical protein